VLLILAALAHRKQVSDAERPPIPVPVLFTAQGWDPGRQPIQDWLVRRIQETYPLFGGEKGALNAAALIAAGKVSVILDGLDEMAVTLQPIALQALSQQAAFRVVVLSRTAEMASAASGQGVLEGAAAVELQKIDPVTAADYLTSVQLDPPPDGWRQLIDYIRKMPESALAHALDNPLTLTLVKDTYPRADDPHELLDFCNATQPGVSDVRQVEDIIDHLLSRVLSAAYKPRPGEGRPAYELCTAQRAFANIAAEMNRQRARDLTSWELQWWAQRRLSAIIHWFIAPAVVAVIAGLVAWLMAGIRTGVVIGIATWVICWPPIWVVNRLTSRLAMRAARYDARKGTFVTKSSKVIWQSYLINTTVISLVVVVVAMVEFGAAFSPADGFRRALIIGLTIASVSTFGLIFNLTLTGWQADQDKSHSLSPLASWRRERKFLLVTRLLFGFTVAVALGVAAGAAFGSARGVTAGIIIGITYAAVAALDLGLWLLAFVRLARRWHMPVHLMRFLDDARERGVLRTVGPRYQFRHARLQDLLAKQEPN
jgi:hypothetical protein